MKKIIIPMALLSLSAFGKDVYWSNKSIDQFKYITDSSENKKAIYECFQGDRLVIQGKVKLTHKFDEDLKQEPQSILIRCDYVHFEEESELSTHSNLGLYVLKELSGHVKIKSTRGLNGVNGKNSDIISQDGKSGYDGSAGGSGSKAKCSVTDMSPPSNGDRGTHGYNGSIGGRGFNGYSAESGISASHIIIEATAIDPETTISTTARGGHGGVGGNGGRGGEGGDGGQGGLGGRGGHGTCAYWTYRGGDGGNGGNGGHGGHGGDGGAGGPGGKGGNGGNVRLWIINPTKYMENFYLKDLAVDLKAGEGGLGGAGGEGGNGGRGGNGGAGGRGGNGLPPLTDKGDSGSEGLPGNPGDKGQTGPQGTPGDRGQDGKLLEIKIQQVAPRDLEFYNLPKPEKRMINIRQLNFLIKEDQKTNERLNDQTLINLM